MIIVKDPRILDGKKQFSTNSLDDMTARMGNTGTRFLLVLSTPGKERLGLFGNRARNHAAIVPGSVVKEQGGSAWVMNKVSVFQTFESPLVPKFRFLHRPPPWDWLRSPHNHLKRCRRSPFGS